jgi:N-acetyl-alpha-D-glucosaminyl L-malate synthase BshA
LTTSFPRFKGDSAGTFIYSLISLLSQKGIDFEVIAPHASGTHFFERWGNIHINRFPYFFPLNYQRLCYGDGLLNNLRNSRLAVAQTPFFILVDFIYLLYILRKKRIDLIHAHWSLPQGFLGILAGHLLRVPCVTTLHGSDVFGLRRPIFRLPNKFAIRHADICTANSRATAQKALRMAACRNLMIIPMGVDLNHFKKTTEVGDLRKKLRLDGEVILSVGRLIDLKGTDYLIKALPKVLLRFPQTKALIIGSGPQKSYLLNLAKELHIKDSVVFVGQIPHSQMAKYYSLADVFVLPSITSKMGETEGFGVVLLEAMACGLPVIGSDTGGIPDIIKDGETGLLFRQKDSQELANQIIRLLTDEDLRKKMVVNARNLVETQFSWEIVAERFIEVYSDMLAGKSPATAFKSANEL